MTHPMLFSFDVDGTLETGDPVGPIPLGFVRRVLAAGHRVGSCSDRTLAEQSAMWTRAGIDVHFLSRKHELAVVRAGFACGRFLHIGDTHVDRYYAELAGFDFVHVDELARRLATIPPVRSGPAGSAEERSDR